MKIATIAFLPLFSSFTLASFIVDTVTKAALTCEPVLLKWQGGLTPWTLRIVAVDGSIIDNLGTSKQTSFRWTVDVDAGTVVAAQVTDSKGAVATSNSFTVQPGTTGCTPQKFVALPPTSDSGAISSTDVGTSTTASSSQDAHSTANTISTANIVSTTNTISTPSGIASAPTTSSLSPGSKATGSVTYSMMPVAGDPSTAFTASKKPSAGMVFAVLIPCLIVLAFLGFLFLRWRRRHREGLSALEAQTPEPSGRWFDKPAYRTTSNFDRLSVEVPAQEVAAPPEVEPVTQRPALNIIPYANGTTVGLESGRTPATAFLTSAATSTLPSGIPYSTSPVTSLDNPSKYVETLESRITALVAENAYLANLASPQDMPPPAYA